MSEKPAPQPSQGKGSKTRVKDLKSYRENYDEIFKKKPLTEAEKPVNIGYAK